MWSAAVICPYGRFLMQQPLIEIKNITKKFGAVQALSAVDLRIFSGEVHALLGENGAGKSTLMKILSGILTPTSGEILIEGKAYTHLTHHQAADLGISIIYQELSLIEELSVLENIFIGRLLTKKRFGIRLVDWAAMRRQAQLLLHDLGLEIDLDEKVENLSIAYKQMVEIAKALATNARILIMDEPSSSLTDNEVTALFKIIDKLRQQNTAIIYISHKLKEIRRLCDRYSVLRDGRSMGEGMIAATDDEDIIRLMVGRDLERQGHNKAMPSDKILLRVENLTAKDGQSVQNVSFDIKEGEILGFAGLIGAGRTEIMNCIFGINPCKQGKIIFKGRDITPTRPFQAVRNGIAYVTETRRQNGFFPNFSIADNIAMVKSLKQGGYSGMMGCFSRAEERSQAEEFKQLLAIKCHSLEQNITDLSGGNQQKVIIAKWMACKPDVIIFDEPTRGIDVGAKAEIYKIMRDLSSAGKAVIMISSELPEILGLCDKIAVVRQGMIAKIIPNNHQTSEEEIMRWALPN